MWKRIKNFISGLFGSSGDIIPLASGGSGNPISPEASCVAHYKMNDDAADTVVLDSQGYSNGMAQQNTADLTTTGKVGGALTFNGTDDYVDTNDTFQSTFRDSFSINLWCKADDGIPDDSPYFYGADSFVENQKFEAYLKTNGKLEIYYRTGGQYCLNVETDDAVFSDGVQPWTMITMIITKLSTTTAQGRIYVNGILIKTGDIETVSMGDYTSAVQLSLGGVRFNGSIAGFFSGPLDSVMIFNKALNTEEISILYNSGRGTENFQLTPQLNMVGTALEMAVV